MDGDIRKKIGGGQPEKRKPGAYQHEQVKRPPVSEEIVSNRGASQKSLQESLVAAMYRVIEAGQRARVEEVKTKRASTAKDGDDRIVRAARHEWLEADTPAARTWVSAQDKQTRAFLEHGTTSLRSEIRMRYERLSDNPHSASLISGHYRSALDNYYAAPVRVGEDYYFLRKDPDKQQAVLYRQEGLTGKPHTILDPQERNLEGTTAITSLSVSPDGRVLAYSLSHEGKDWHEIHIRDLKTGVESPEVLRHVQFPEMAWDGPGFYYPRLPEKGTVPMEQERNRSVYYHRVGTEQTRDRLVFQPDPSQRTPWVKPYVVGHSLILRVHDGSDKRHTVWYRQLASANRGGASSEAFHSLMDQANAIYDVMGKYGPVFYVHTNLDAPGGRIVALNQHHPEREHWQTLVLAKPGEKIDQVRMVGGHLVVCSQRDISHHLSVYRKDGTFVREIPLPMPGTISSISGMQRDTRLFFEYSSFLHPPTIFCYEMATGELTRFHETKTAFRGSDYTMHQEHFVSKDGTIVPLFMVHKQGQDLTEQTPVLLHAYGGFDYSLTPAFEMFDLGMLPQLWLEQGGAFVVVNARGGGEYPGWHEAGKLGRKQNTFDDVDACAQYLVREHGISEKHLVYIGRSNGGWVGSACLVQHPDHFGAFILGEPLTDMVNYTKYGGASLYWREDIGDPANPKHVPFLLEHSPLHNVTPGASYPPTLILTGENDQRVPPSHAIRFTAALQEAQGGEHPICLLVAKKAGHNVIGKSRAQVMAEMGNIFSFLHRVGIVSFDQARLPNM